MAKQSRLESIVSQFDNIESARLELKAKWDSKTTEQRDIWAKELGYASDRSLYVAFREPPYSILPGGSCRNGECDSERDSERPRKRSKGALPKAIETWAILSAQADYLLDGNSDEFEAPEVTPEWFLSLRAVRNETKAFHKALDRIGGIDSDAGKSLRAWAGRPLTNEQAQQEAAEREQAAAATLLPKIAKLLWKARELASYMESSDLMEEIESLIDIHKLPDND